MQMVAVCYYSLCLAFHPIAEICCPSMEVLQTCASSEGGKQTIANAASISSSGPPGIWIAEEQIE